MTFRITRATNRRVIALLGSVAACSLGTVAPALAQSDDATSRPDATKIEEVIVTAQRRNEALVDVPISITAFSSSAIEKNMITDVEDYFRRSPNVFITTGATRSGNVSTSELSLAIRGVSNIGGIASSFGAYVDDFNVTRATLNPHLVDIERIEVLRGPQSTFFGRNASGGVFAIYTKKPVDRFESSASAEISSFGTYDFEGVLNIPVTSNFAIRAVGKLASSNGNLKNANPIGGDNGYDDQHFRLSGRWTPTSELTVDLSGGFTDEKQHDFGLVHTGVVSSFINSICAPPVTCPGDQAQGYYPDNLNTYNHDFPLKVHDRYWWINNKTEYANDQVRFTNVVGYISTNFDRSGELDFSSYDFLREEYDTIHRTAVSDEVRLQSNNDSPFSWTIGGVYAIDTEAKSERINIGSQNGLGLPDRFPIEISTNDTKVKSAAVFGEASYKLTDTLTATAGLRWSNDHLTSGGTLVDFGTDMGAVSDSRSYTHVSPRFVLSYEPRKNLNLYASVTEGWKAGGFVHRPGSPINTFAPESLWSYETGAKGTFFDGRLQASATAFYIDWNDIQVQSSIFITRPDGSIASVSAVSNGAHATSKGVELELIARPVSQLELSLNVGYDDAHFTSFKLAQTSSGLVDLSGKPLPKAPKWTVSASAQYNIDLGPDWQAFVRGEYQYSDETFTNVNNIAFSLAGQTFPFRVPSQGFFNLRAGVTRGQYAATFYVNNLFDNHAYTSSYDFGFVDGAAVFPAFRTVGLRLSAKFN